MESRQVDEIRRVNSEEAACKREIEVVQSNCKHEKEVISDDLALFAEINKSKMDSMQLEFDASFDNLEKALEEKGMELRMRTSLLDSVNAQIEAARELLKPLVG